MRRICLLSLALVACDGEGEPEVVGNVLSRKDIARIASVVDDALGRGLATGYSLAVWRDGEIIFAEAYGTRNEAGQEVTVDTLFQLGSDTKKLTALAVMREVEAGVLALEDTVSELVPELELASNPGTFDIVRIEHLLSHRSGLYDYTPWYDAPQDARLAETVLGVFAAEEHAMMPPGIAWNYSNANYGLLGFVLEQATGQSYVSAVQDGVLTPLALDHTYLRRDDMLARESDVASGHGLVPEGADDWFDPFVSPAFDVAWVAPEAQPDHAFTRPAGFAWSTASDHARLLGFFIDGDPRVLSDDRRRSMMQKRAPLVRHADDVSYGHALMVSDGFYDADGAYRKTPTIQHGGNTLTMTSSAMFLPRERVAVAVLANGYGENLSGIAITALQVAAQKRLPATSWPPGRPLPARSLAAYPGVYSDPKLGEVTLSLVEGALRIDVPRFDELGAAYEHTLTPLMLDLFSWRVGDTHMQLGFYDETKPRAYAVHRAFVLSRGASTTTRAHRRSMRAPPSMDLLPPLLAPPPPRYP